jgi:uncharacterized protein DUF4440
MPVARHILRTLRVTAGACALLLAACTPALRVGDDGLAAAERAFARLAGEVGVRDAFIASFAPDGLVFEPAPVRVRDAWPARPSPPQPAAQRLQWQPALVVVAASGDLGFSTGPFRVVEAASGDVRTHGAFFSVWQRDPGGPWQVWLDMGATTPGPVEDVTWSVVPRPAADGAPGGASVDAVMALDRALSGVAADTFGGTLAIDARQHRHARVPLFAADWVAALKRDGATATYEPVEARVARAGDLAAVHGRVVRRAGGVHTPGRYVHVWLRDRGAWRLAVETLVDET